MGPWQGWALIKDAWPLWQGWALVKDAWPLWQGWAPGTEPVAKLQQVRRAVAWASGALQPRRPSTLCQAPRWWQRDNCTSPLAALPMCSPAILGQLLLLHNC